MYICGQKKRQSLYSSFWHWTYLGLSRVECRSTCPHVQVDRASVLSRRSHVQVFGKPFSVGAKPCPSPLFQVKWPVTVNKQFKVLHTGTQWLNIWPPLHADRMEQQVKSKTTKHPALFYTEKLPVSKLFLAMNCDCG